MGRNRPLISEVSTFGASGPLARRLVLPLSGFVLLTSLLMVLWMLRLQRAESREQFRQLAATNAEFVSGLPLPRSPEMAGRLGSILGVEVAFIESDGTLARDFREPPAGEFREMLRCLVADGPGFVSVDGRDLAAAPLGESGAHLVLSRPRQGGLAGLAGWVAVPALGLTLASGVLVMFLAHRIVRPLGELTRWLPNMESDEAAPIPPAVAGRDDEIGRLARTLEESHQRLRREQERRRQSERMAALGQIATRLAHEIRNPAAAIRMHADLLGRSRSVPDPGVIRLIQDEVDRISDLVNQWLFVVRAAPPETRRHDLAGLVDRVVGRMQPALDHAGVGVRRELDGELWIDADRLRIEQVLRNLLANAVQAMPEGGEVVLRGAREDGRVTLSVRDTGKGFSEEGLRRFGEAFFSEREGGMGIGLTLAREVVQAHGGRIRAANPPGGGGEVRLTLPAGTSQASS